jgi:hypothetical protein
MPPAENHEEKIISRRRLLEILAATGGAITTSSVLPSQWTKPVVEVGVLPAHAQVTQPAATPTLRPANTSTPTPTSTSTPTPTPTDTPIPTIYAMVCDSTPGGGDITAATDFCIANVAVIISLVSGSGPVAGITVTMTCSNPLISFSGVSLPQTAVTDASGRADFGTLCIVMDNNVTDGMEFDLLFSCTDPVNGGTLDCECGTYRILLAD